MSDLNKRLLNKKRRIHLTKSEEDNIDLTLKFDATSNKYCSKIIKLDVTRNNIRNNTMDKFRKNKGKIISLKTNKTQISKKKKNITSQNFINANEENLQQEIISSQRFDNKEISVPNYINSSDLELNSKINLACDNLIDNPKLSETNPENIFDENKMKIFFTKVDKQEELTIMSQYEREIKFCSICIENVSFIDKHYLRCGHIFHLSCISEWFKKKNICPNCKQPDYDISCNLLNENLSVFSEADFNDVILLAEIREARILRNYNEESLNFANDIALFLEVIDRHRFLVIFVIYVFFYLSFKIAFMMKSLDSN